MVRCKKRKKEHSDDEEVNDSVGWSFVGTFATLRSAGAFMGKHGIRHVVKARLILQDIVLIWSVVLSPSDFYFLRYSQERITLYLMSLL